VLTPVAESVLIHQIELLQNNTVVVQGRGGVLLIDPGIQGFEMACLANAPDRGLAFKPARGPAAFVRSRQR